MNENQTKSPAVESLKEEQAAQNKPSKNGELEVGLEDTFPASDPVSVTRTDSPTAAKTAEGSK